MSLTIIKQYPFSDLSNKNILIIGSLISIYRNSVDIVNKMHDALNYQYIYVVNPSDNQRLMFSMMYHNVIFLDSSDNIPKFDNMDKSTYKNRLVLYCADSKHKIDNNIKEILYNGRYIKTTVIVVCMEHYLLEVSTRSQFDAIFLFYYNHKHELKKMFSDAFNSSTSFDINYISFTMNDNAMVIKRDMYKFNKGKDNIYQFKPNQSLYDNIVKYIFDIRKHNGKYILQI